MSLVDIKEKILAAEKKHNRAIGSTTLIAVSKVQPLERVEFVLKEGHRIFGENRVQEAQSKWPLLKEQYDNVEQIWGYKENDQMGGKDIYSGSKGAAELVIKSYFYSFFNNESCNVKIGVARAGNVIGGGDWARDRIVVDCMLAWSEGKHVEIRSPNATRPWQHVLEPLSGYLKLGLDLFNNSSLNGEAFNFGPKSEQNRTVKELLEDLSRYWVSELSETFKITDSIPFHEAELLKLNCDKALAYLKWQASLSYHETIKFTSEWYFNFYKNTDVNIFDFTMSQIEEYEKMLIENYKSI